MPDWLDRDDFRYLRSVAEANLPKPVASYVESPDLSAVEGWPSMYWVLTGDTVTLMTQVQRDAVDAALLAIRRDQDVEELLADPERIIRQIVILTVDEINAVRTAINDATAATAHIPDSNLPMRTFAQVKAQLRAALGS